MIDRIKAIIEREVERLDKLSEVQALSLDDIRALELLGKVQRSFDKPTADDKSDKNTQPPSTSELLEGLIDGE